MFFRYLWATRVHTTELSQTIQKSHALIYLRLLLGFHILVSQPANSAYHNKSPVPSHPKIRGIPDNGPPTSMQGRSKAQQALCWLDVVMPAPHSSFHRQTSPLKRAEYVGILQLQDATVSVRRLIHLGQGGTWDVGPWLEYACWDAYWYLGMICTDQPKLWKPLRQSWSKI